MNIKNESYHQMCAIIRKIYTNIYMGVKRSRKASIKTRGKYRKSINVKKSKKKNKTKRCRKTKKLKKTKKTKRHVKKKSYIKKGGYSDSDEDAYPGHDAARRGDIDVVRRYTNKINEYDDYGDTMLSIAIENKHADLVRFLLSRNASINVPINGSTILELTATNPDIFTDEINNMIIERAAEVGLIPLEDKELYMYYDKGDDTRLTASNLKKAAGGEEEDEVGSDDSGFVYDDFLSDKGEERGSDYSA